MTRPRWLITLLFAALSAAALAHQAEAQLVYTPISPCRVVDTRNPAGPYGGPALTGGSIRSFVIPGQCGVPATAKAVAFNFTVVGATGPQGFLTVWPADTPLPVAALLEFGPGQSTVVSNSANLKLAEIVEPGAISAYVSNIGGAVHLIINVYGYFDPGS